MNEIFCEELGLTIRSATNQDGARVKNLVFAVLREFGLEADPEDTDSDLSNLESSYADRGGIFELIESNDGKLMGTYGLYPVTESTVELRKMYFSPALRGHGLGRKVLQRSIEKSQFFGFSQIYLETAAVLKQAINLYRSIGFEPTETIHSKRCDQAFVFNLREK